MTEEKGLLAALERIADAAEKGEQGSGGLGRMARDAVAAYKARPVAPASADEVLRPALLDHYPQGVWHQQDGGYAGSCVCGHLFAGRILWEARSAWADHVIAALTAQAHPAGDGAARGLEKLGPGEFYVDGDKFDLIFRPGGGCYAGDDQIVARMACGETAYYLPSVVARLLNNALATHPRPDEAQVQSGEGEAVALEAYRAAVRWIAADSWDGCSECIRILQMARSLDDMGWTPDQHAAALKRLYERAGQPAIAHPAPASDAGEVVPSRWAGVIPLVEQITAEEGASVTFVCGNPDFNGLPNEAVTVFRGEDWQEETYRADTLAECLRAALFQGERA